MEPLPWKWALFVWVYALAWFLLNDRVKLLAYRFLDPAKSKPKPEVKGAMPSDLTPEIAKRAYELYDERRRGVQDWEEAEREILKGSHEGKGVR